MRAIGFLLAICLVVAVAVAVVAFPRPMSAAELRERAALDLVARSGSRCVVQANYAMSMPSVLGSFAAGSGPAWMDDSYFRGTPDELAASRKGGLLGRIGDTVIVTMGGQANASFETYNVLTYDGHEVFALASATRAVPCTDD
jgi:hypothetical protein